MGRPRIDHDAVSDATFAEILANCATEILRADGDRDYMNPSNLTVQTTVAIADLMNLAAAKLRAHTEKA